MRRRELLTSTVLASVLPGCTSQLEDTLGGNRAYEVGESVERDGLKVGVLEWDVADNATRFISNDAKKRVTSPQGARILLIRIHSGVIGNNPREFPAFSHKQVMDSDIRVYNDGERVDGVYLWSTREYFLANGKQYQSYEYLLDQSPGEVYPGAEIDGWVGVLVAENFEPEEVSVELSWRGSVNKWELSGPIPTHTNTTIEI